MDTNNNLIKILGATLIILVVVILVKAIGKPKGVTMENSPNAQQQTSNNQPTESDAVTKQ